MAGFKGLRGLGRGRGGGEGRRRGGLELMRK